MVYLLNKNQAALLNGKPFTDDSYFNPVLDADGLFVLSEECVDNTTVEDFLWVKELPKIEYKPKPIEI